MELVALEPASPAARGQLAARAARVATAEGPPAEGAIAEGIDMKFRWYDWLLLIVFGLPIGIYVAVRDRFDAWRYRHRAAYDAPMSTPTPATTTPTPEPALGSAACPRCGCWMTTQAVNLNNKLSPNFCMNCGRFSVQPSDLNVDGLPEDKRCTKGNTVHTHDEPAPTA